MAILYSMDMYTYGLNTIILLVLLPALYMLGYNNLPRLSSLKILDLNAGFLLGEKVFFLMVFFCLLGVSGSWLPIQLFPILIFWLSFCLWGSAVQSWLISGGHSFMSHHTPKDLNYLMGPSMALIELVSTMLRPMILGLRLTANIMGGHLMTELIWDMLPSTYSVHTTLHFLGLYENFVGVIQSVIFSLLALDYYTEAGDSV